MTEPIEFRPLLHDKHAMAYLGVAWAKFYKLLQRGPNENPLPIRMVGKRRRYDIDELREWTKREAERNESIRKARRQRSRRGTA